MPRTAVTGATGLIGSSLVDALLARGDAVVALVRDPAGCRLPAAVELRRWSSGDPVAPLTGVEKVVHLAGASIADGRWTPARKRELSESRVAGTRSVVAGVREASVEVLVSGSGIDAYGDTGELEVDEQSPVSTRGFLPQLCAEWEAAALAAREAGARVVLLRTGLVLAAGGGALAKMLPAFRMGVGGPLGSGRQWVPWIHLADAVGLILHALDHEEVEGPLVVAGPAPLRQRDFAAALGKALHRPALIPVPELVLRTMFGELSEALLSSHRALPRKAEATGYRFRFSTAAGALQELLG